MAKVTVNTSTEKGNAPPAPTSAAVRQRREVTDELGRTITFVKPTALQNMRLFGFVDEKLQRSQGYMLYARLASSVRCVRDPGDADSADSPPPNSTPQLEALVQRLDEEGIGAVMRGWIEAGWISLDDAAAADSQERESRAVKN